MTQLGLKKKKKDNTSLLTHEKPHWNQTLTEQSPSPISLSCRSSSARRHASASWNFIYHDHRRQLPELTNWASDGKSRRSPSQTTVGTSLMRYLSPKLPVATLIGLKFSSSKSSSCMKHESSTRNLRSSNPLPRRWARGGVNASPVKVKDGVVILLWDF